MSLNRLKQNISKIIPINDEEFARITSLLKYEKVPAKKIILKKGQKCDFLSFVLKGCVVQYSKFEEKEFVINFLREDTWVGDSDSFLTQNVSNFYLKTLEETELLTIDYAVFMYLIQNHPLFLQYHLINTHRMCSKSDERLAKMNSLSAEDKYNVILTESADIINRVPSKYLASFLGIEPPSLSRIRRNLSKKQQIL